MLPYRSRRPCLPAPPPKRPAGAPSVTLRSIGEKPFRVCLFGTSTPTAEGLASLKGATLLAHAGDWTQVPPDSMRVDAPASDDPLDVLPSFARAFPRETLILVRSDAVLPTHAFDRLLRAIEFDHVLDRKSVV